MDVSDHNPFDFETRLQELANRALRREKRAVRTRADGWCELEGRMLVNFGANDYLNLAHDPRLVQAAIEAMQSEGVGATASPLVGGRTSSYCRLEEATAAFEQTEASIIFPTGYAANLGVIQSVAQARDLVFCDRMNHASLVDACRSSAAEFCVYRSDRLDDLRQALQRRRSQAKRVWIVTDAVFSMDGTVAPLSELCTLADESGAAVIVDEAHGTGVLGEHGRGATELANCEDRVAVRIGTFSKAVGCLGGFAVGSRSLCDWLWNSARTQFFSTALPPGICAAAATALPLISANADGRRSTLAGLTNFTRRRLVELELPTIPAGVAPIIPVIIGDAGVAVDLSRTLETHGYFVPAIRPPTVPAGTSRLRISLSAAHTQVQINDLLLTIRQLVSA